MVDSDGVNDDDELFFEWIHHHRRMIQIDLLSGTISGACNCISTQPMDTIKVRMQISTNNFRTVAYQTWKKEGVLAFFKGMEFPLIAIPAINAIVFTTYEFWKRLLHVHHEEGYQWWKIMICGGIAGSAAALISSPVELAKIRLQVQQTQVVFKGPFDVMKHIYYNEGLKALYRGCFAAQFREIIGYGAQFCLYDYIMYNIKYVKKRHPYNQEILVAGGLAGMACWLTSYPQDTIKTLIQLEKGVTIQERKYKIHKYIPDGGFFDCYQQIVQNEGYRGLFKGLLGTCFRGFYGNAVGFYFYEIARSFIEPYFNQKNE